MLSSRPRALTSVLAASVQCRPGGQRPGIRPDAAEIAAQQGDSNSARSRRDAAGHGALLPGTLLRARASGSPGRLEDVVDDVDRRVGRDRRPGTRTVASPPLITTMSPSTAMASVPLSVAQVAGQHVRRQRLADDDVVAEDRVEQLGVGEHRVENVRRDLADGRVGRSEDRERARAGELVVERGGGDGGRERRQLVELGGSFVRPGDRRRRRGRHRRIRRGDRRPRRRAERWSPTSGRRRRSATGRRQRALRRRYGAASWRSHAARP